MIRFREVRNTHGEMTHVETSITGRHLLTVPELNKGCAFTEQERDDFLLQGRLPPGVESLEKQAERMYQQYGEQESNLQKNIFLNNLHDFNETLFYKVVGDHLQEMLPIIYTPTVGTAVERFSLELRRPRGLYFSYPNRDKIAHILRNRLIEEIDLVVVTDGERVLGIGDQGVGGMNISIAKLMVYTLCAGVNPHRVVPIQLDVGTNNPKLLNDPMYLGWRHPRISGQEYDEFIGLFVTALRQFFPNIYLHWEDFGRDNARKNLERYRHEMCTFNDDMQGTGIVTVANVMSAVAAIGGSMAEQRFVFLGAGTAGVGIADQIYDAVLEAGLTPEQARACFWLVDRDGLLMESSAGLMNFQKPYVRNAAEVAKWQLDQPGKIMLADVVRNVHPTVLIGCSTVGGAFSEAMIRDMAAHTERPIIMPLSNPTANAEAMPRDIIPWTDGRAIIATGSPFAPVSYNGKTYEIAQGNNAFVFPGLGLGVIISKANRVTDAMIRAAAHTLADHSPSKKDPTASLLPSFDDIVTVSQAIAKAVARQAIADGVAGIDGKADLDFLIKRHTWEPKYYPFRYVNG